jgi:hypothetical protein
VKVARHQDERKISASLGSELSLGNDLLGCTASASEGDGEIGPTVGCRNLARQLNELLLFVMTERNSFAVRASDYNYRALDCPGEV